MRKIIFRERWMEILLGSILVLSGLVVTILSIVNQNILTNALSIILAISLFLVGGLYLINGLAKTANSNVIDSTYILASIAISLGVVLLVDQTIIAKVIVYVVSTSILAFGAALLIRGIVLCARRATKASCVLAIILGVILIILGVLALIFQSSLTQLIYISTGVLLLAMGIIQIVEAAK